MLHPILFLYHLVTVRIHKDKEFVKLNIHTQHQGKRLDFQTAMYKNVFAIHKKEHTNFDSHHYTNHFVTTLDVTIGTHMLIDQCNTLAYWIGMMNIKFMYVYTLRTVNTSAKHNRLNIVYSISTFDTQVNKLSIDIYDNLLQLLAMRKDPNDHYRDYIMHIFLEFCFTKTENSLKFLSNKINDEPDMSLNLSCQ